MEFAFTAAFAAGVIVNVAVDSASGAIGPIAFGASTVQPAGTVSAAVPAGSVPEPDLTCSVAWNGAPGAL